MIRIDIKKVIIRGMTGEEDIKLINMVKIPNKTLKYEFILIRLLE
jgi:hypothetical protein